MFKFLGIVLVVIVPVFLVALAVARHQEEEKERMEADRRIKEGLRALGHRITNLEILKRARREKRS